MKTKSPYTLKDNDLLLTSGGMINAYKINPQKLRDLPDVDKPREKLLVVGPEQLSTKELLAIILEKGTKKEDVFSMAERILKEYGEQTLTNLTDPKKISDDLDIPINKAMQVVACGELGRRFFSRNESGRAVLRVAEDVFEYTKDMATLPREHLRGLYLDTHYRVVRDEVISIGTINTNLIHPREVLKPAIEYNAAAFILVHNHPSGIATPSASDIEITKQIVEAGKIIGINLLDHIVVTKDGYESIKVEY